MRFFERDVGVIVVDFIIHDLGGDLWHFEDEDFGHVEREGILELRSCDCLDCYLACLFGVCIVFMIVVRLLIRHSILKLCTLLFAQLARFLVTALLNYHGFLPSCASIRRIVLRIVRVVIEHIAIIKRRP